MKKEYKEFLEKYKIEYIVITLIFIFLFHIIYNLTSIKLINFAKEYKILYNVIILLLSIFIFLLANISYPKIYKFKILLSGYVLIAIFIEFLLIINKIDFNISIMGFKFDFFDKAWTSEGKFSLKVLLTLLNLNLLFIILSKPTINYETGKKISLIALIFNLFIYIFILYYISGEFRGNNENLFATQFVRNFNKHFLPLNLLILFLIIIFSILNIEEEHNYGSIIVSVSLFTFYCSLQADKVWPVRLILPFVSLIVIVGILSHWISCLHHRAHYDPLLKIYNRQFMDDIINGVTDVSLGSNYSVLMCDIDHFKKINDTYGHATGDLVLHKVAQLIRNISLPEGITCRYGGEEIIIFLRGKIEDEAISKAERIRKNIKKQTIKVKNKNIKVTLSIGVSSTTNGIKDIKKVIKKADEGVYKAKKKGRDRVVYV